MAAIVSKQAAKIAAGTKLSGADFGKKVAIVFTSPDTVTWADGDTFASGQRLPIGTRILCDSFASHADMGTSITLDVGLRNFSTGAVVDADAIAAAVDVATAAARTAINNGAKVAAGVEYVTTEECEIYATLAGGTPTANAQIRIEVSVLVP
jgi:hypothetical protein